MRIVCFGASGQVAQELARAGVAASLGRNSADFADPDALARVLREVEADAFINAAAWTAVDDAENHEAEATRINGAAPGVLAEEAARRGIPLVHISTDYVFGGGGETAFRPGDPTGPLSAYGRSKLAGEEAVRGAGGSHAILRTAWVFSAHGGNFVKTMLRLAETRDRLSVVADQVGGPTPAAAIADACLSIARQLAEDPSKSGTYHFSGAPDLSWAEFARAIFAEAGRAVTVADIASEEYPTPAARPRNSRLDCSATETAFGIARPDWRAGLRDVLKELGA